MRKILSVIISLCLIFPVCDVQASRLEPFLMGIAAKHLPKSDKQKLKKVSKNCATAIDSSGYVDTYLKLRSIVMQNYQEEHVRYYKIKTPDDFLKIYELLHNTQFKVLRTKRTPHYDCIYIDHPSDLSDNCVLFPMNYDSQQKSEDDDCKRHLKNLRKFESEITLEGTDIINDNCIRPELFFQICFDMNEQMYPDCCFDINKKNEFRSKLQDFLIRQTISWASSVGYTKIRQIPDTHTFLNLHSLDYLRHNLEHRTYVGGADLTSAYADLYQTFVGTPNPDSVFKQEVYAFKVQHVIDGLWRQNKLTRNFSYVADIEGKKLRISPNADGNIDAPGLHSVSITRNLCEWTTHKAYHKPFLSNGPYYHPLTRMCATLNPTLDWLCGLEFDSFKKDFNEFVCNCDTYKLRQPRENLLDLFENLLNIRRHDRDLPDKLNYLGEVLFEDEQNRSCIHYDGILNLLYIFDFFKFPKNVTDQITKYVFCEMIRRCPSIHDLYINEKFDQIVKLSQKLWSINNNDIFLNLKNTLISRLKSARRLNTFDSKLSELYSYSDFISYMADKLDISTSEKETILQSMQETLQKSFSQTIPLKKQEKASSYAPTKTENKPAPSQPNYNETNPTVLATVNEETKISSYAQVSNEKKPQYSDSTCGLPKSIDLENENDAILVSSDEQTNTAQTPNPTQEDCAETDPTVLEPVKDATKIPSYAQVRNEKTPQNSDSTCGLPKSIDLENENDAILVSSDEQTNTDQTPNPSQEGYAETTSTELKHVSAETKISSYAQVNTEPEKYNSVYAYGITKPIDLGNDNEQVFISLGDRTTTAKDPKKSQPTCDTDNFNKYIDISTKSIVLDRTTDETTGNYYENLPSDSELNTTNKTDSKTTFAELETNTEKFTPANKFAATTAIGVLSELIPKLYRKIVKFRKTSKAIKKLKTSNNVINLAS